MAKKFANVDVKKVQDFTQNEYGQYIKKGLTHSVLVQILFAVQQLKAGIWDDNLVGWKNSVEKRLSPLFNGFSSQCANSITDFIISFSK